MNPSVSPVRQRFANPSPNVERTSMAPSFRRFAKPYRAKHETAKQGSGETRKRPAVDNASVRSDAQLAFDLDAGAPAPDPLEAFLAYIASADPYDPAKCPIPY